MINCPDILAPVDEDLLSLVYNEGVLSTPERAHVDQCPLCQRRLASYSDMNHKLLAKLHRGLCPSAVRLNYYCLGVVPAEEHVSLASHLLDCPRCADEVAEIRRVQAAFEPFPVAPPSLGTVVRRLFATLVVQQAQPITRSAMQSTGWPRQYQAGTLDLSLHISRQSNGEAMLIGILTSSDANITVDAFEGIEARLYTAPGPLNGASAEPLLTAQVDEIGNLLLEPIPAGAYIMLIHLPDQEIVIEGLTI
jgi:hypothetical protein